jgi:YfiH family protein
LSAAPFVTAATLSLPGIAHAFFTRSGGVSQGVYASLNGGVGSRDAPEAVAENRARMAAALGLSADRLAVLYQVHSPDAIAVSEHWAPDARPRCDGIVTATPGLALGVTGADCGMILFADAEARVVGAAHAGWKGALAGVVEATVAAMERLGARRDAIAAALGPCIAQDSYEVGPEFVAAFAAAGEATERFFVTGRRSGHAMFDLKAISPSAPPAPASASSRTCGSTPMPTKRASSATGGRPIAASPTTAGSYRRSYWPDLPLACLDFGARRAAMELEVSRWIDKPSRRSGGRPEESFMSVLALDLRRGRGAFPCLGAIA